jgi:hypothetical protein
MRGTIWQAAAMKIIKSSKPVNFSLNFPRKVCYWLSFIVAGDHISQPEAIGKERWQSGRMRRS